MEARASTRSRKSTASRHSKASGTSRLSRHEKLLCEELSKSNRSSARASAYLKSHGPDEETGLLTPEPRKSSTWIDAPPITSGKNQPRQGNLERDFEEKALELIRNGLHSKGDSFSDVWVDLENAAVDQLDQCKGKSPKGFFYLGVALYKMDYYEQAITAFEKSVQQDSKDAQAHYNLALAYFKRQSYDDAEKNLIVCRDLDPGHRYAWNNLAFIYNMFKLYPQAIDTCKWAH